MSNLNLSLESGIYQENYPFNTDSPIWWLINFKICLYDALGFFSIVFYVPIFTSNLIILDILPKPFSLFS